MNKKQKRGFTLIELLVVVLVIGILAAVALPQYQFAVEKARATEALVNLKTVANAIEVYYLANGHYPTSLGDLDIKVPTLTYFNWRLLGQTYIGLYRKDGSYRIARVYNNSTSSLWKGRYSCDVHLPSNTTDSLGGKICKSLCEKDMLTQIWGSAEPGCVISR